MKCVSSASFNVLWDGDKSDHFTPSRGIRQGDPLSPYLFAISMERLTHMIDEADRNNVWCPLKAGRIGHGISHLLFEDDLLIFTEASISQMDRVLDVLNSFCSASGHNINRAKASIFFSKNMNPNVRYSIVERSGFTLADGIGRYLGALFPNGRRKKNNFKGIINRMGSKLAGWKAQCLSMVGRVVLAQFALGSMASFAMLHTKIPLTTCNELEKAQRALFGVMAQDLERLEWLAGR